jgi:hypothetical protein
VNINTVRSVALVKNRRELIKLRLMRRLAFIERDIYRDVGEFGTLVMVNYICYMHVYLCGCVCLGAWVGGCPLGVHNTDS